MSEVSIRSIIEKLRYKSVTIGTTRTDAFTSNVPEDKMRCIVAIFLIGDGSASRTVDIEKKEEVEAGATQTYETIFNDVPIAPAEVKQLPQTYDLQHPLIVLEGGTNLTFTASGGSPKATVIYWDK